MDRPGLFHPDIPKLQVAWDAVSMNALQTCPYYYRLTILEGWRPKRPNVPQLFGSLFHKAMETYFKARIDLTHPDALDLTVLEALKTCDGLPEEGERDPRSRFTLLRSIIWYLDKFESSQSSTLVKNDGVPAVEVSFRIAVPMEHTHGPYLLCGHIDRISVEPNGQAFVNDYKTTAKTIGSHFFRAFDLDWQMSNYIFALATLVDSPDTIGWNRGARIDAIQVANGFTRVERGFTYRTRSQIEEWLGDTFSWIRLAEKFAEEEDYPKNLRSCRFCDFKDVCSKSKESRSEWLNEDFAKAPWNPLANR